MSIRAMALAVALSCCATTFAAEPPHDATTSIAAVLVNGRQVFDTRDVLSNGDGEVWLTVEDWKSIKGLNLDLNGKSGLVSASELGLEPLFNSELQAFDLKAPSRLLPRQRLNGRKRARATEVAEQPKGALVNYDIAATVDDDGKVAASVAHDARIALGAGTVVATGQVNATQEGAAYKRGITTWHYDHLSSGTTVSVGDVFTPRSQMTGQVNLAGVRIGSDRALRADEYFIPVPLIGGVADTRTAAEIFVNDRRVGSGSVNAGPWDLGQVPVLPGSNDIRLVLRDEFGREEVVSSRFYNTTKLLPKGQNEWEVALGAVRQDNNGYSTPSLVARFERGATDHWTIGGSVQATDEASNVALSNRIALGSAGVLSIDAAQSSSPRGSGHALAASYDYKGRNWSTHVGHSRYSESYWQLSQEAGQPTADTWLAKSSTTASISIAPRGGTWSLSAAGAKIDYHNGKSRERADVSARYRFGANELGAGIGRDLDTGDQSAYLSFRHNFGQGASMSATARRAPEPVYQVSGSGRAHIGNQAIRWTASAEDREAGTRIRGSAYTNTDKGDASLSVEHDEWGTRATGRFQGSVWLGEGGVSTQRTSRGSFILVEVPGQEGVPVSGVGGYANTTNKNGMAIVPSVQSLVPNPVKIDSTTIRADVSLDTNAKMATVGRRGGGKVRFELLSERVVELRITRGGAPMEPPALAKTEAEEAIVGHGGVLVLLHAEPNQVLTIEHSAGACEVRLPEILPEIGHGAPLECKEAP